MMRTGRNIFGPPKSRSGLRNRNRNGRSTYSIKNKSRHSDRYGSYANGQQTGLDVIAGRTLKRHEHG